jgi:hypothetical protein
MKHLVMREPEAAALRYRGGHLESSDTKLLGTR